MGKPVLFEGARFGRVTVISRYEKEFTTYSSDDGMESTKWWLMYEFKCDCGAVFELKVDDWQGKKHTPDCGCGIAEKSEGKKTLLVIVPASVAERVRIASRANGISQWLRDAITMKLDGGTKL